MNRMTPDAANEYRRSVLDALGEDDPVQVQETEMENWRRLIDQAGAHLRTRPEPGEWSVLECLAHLADAELVTSARYRWVLSEAEPTLLGYDQNAWASALNYSDADPASLLDLFGTLRRANVALWRRTAATERTRVGLHAERGPESYELLFRMQAGHGRVHRAQAERALAAVRRPKPVA
jgi:DinB superfamily